MNIFETDEVFIHHAETNNPVVVVTFSHLDYNQKGISFWGASPLEKLGYSAIGIVAKRDIWYPPAVMDQTLEAVERLTAQYSSVIAYGFSMGAYGALKYSKRIGANTVIALSPQASVDVTENRFMDLRFYNHDIHQKMGIKTGDIGGNAFLIYDPYMEADNWSAHFVLNAHPETHLITAPRAQHETIDMFSSTEALSELLLTCSEGNPQKVSKLVHRLRKPAWRVDGARNAYLAARRNRNAQVYEIEPEATQLADGSS